MDWSVVGEDDFLQLFCTAADDREVLGDGSAPGGVQTAGVLVADSTMDATAAGKDPEKVFEPEVVAKRPVEDFDGDCHQFPALFAHLRAGAARADVVVVGHVDVEAEPE